MDHSSKQSSRVLVLERLEATVIDIESAMNVCKAPSISVGVLHNGEVLFQKSRGLRDVEANLEADGDTSYFLGSCSKMITATALGILAEEKKLSWNDKIRKHLHNFNPIEDPEIGREATLIDACRHSTGLANPNTIFLGPEGTFSNKAEDHIAMVNALPTSNKSGQRFRKWWYYSSAVFGILGQVIEVATDTTYADFLRERILSPLGLKQTLVCEADVGRNANLAHPYVQMANGKWSRIQNGITNEHHSPTLACMGIRSSVNDMLAFFAAVMNRYDEEQEIGAKEPLLHKASQNPLKQITAMWNYWWTRPMEDGFDNKTAYTLGWYRTTMPTGALGLTSYNYHRYIDEDKSWMKSIIGQGSKPHTLYGHNGITNGSVATAYVFPSSHTAVVALSNAADAGDASETVAQILLQAIFDLSPRIDLISSLRKSRERCLKAHREMILDWTHHSDVEKYRGLPEDYLGTYVGLNTSRIDIVPSDSAAAQLAVVYAENDASKCDLEPYNDDQLSFLPMNHIELLARGMIDWDYYKVGIFEFVRDGKEVVGLWWQWDRYDYPGLWVRKKDGMEEEMMNEVLERFGRFRKPTAKPNEDKPEISQEDEAGPVKDKLCTPLE